MSVPPEKSFFNRKNDSGGAPTNSAKRHRNQAASSIHALLAHMDQEDVTPLAIEALIRCHEMFLRVLAAELVANGNSEAKTLQRVPVAHVHRAMDNLGMTGILKRGFQLTGKL